MKINSSYWKDDPDDKKSRRADWVAQARREAVKNEESAAMKHRQAEPLSKEENKFSGILESATTQQKLKQTNENSGEQRREDEKKDRKNAAAHDKDSSDGAAFNDRIERNASQFGGQFGGSGGFGGDVNQAIHLSENFAARSILHIADLERMISAVRKLTKLDGKREITLELKNSVLEGLKVKITTGDAAQISIEFLAANEKVRSQIEDHSEELSNILRGRGINLSSLRTSLYAEARNESENFESQSEKEVSFNDLADRRAESSVNNTFENKEKFLL